MGRRDDSKDICKKAYASFLKYIHSHIQKV